MTSAKILIVDDDLGFLNGIKKTLKREGFAIITARSGQEAIAWLKDNTADLMLFDLSLQDIEGRELMTHLEFIGRAMPFIVITSQTDERLAVEMMKRGALDYLVKNGEFMDLLPTVVRRSLTQLADKRRLAVIDKMARLTGTIVEQSPSPALIARRNGSNPEIHYVNRAFSRVLGCSLQQTSSTDLKTLEELTGKWRLFRRAIAMDSPMTGEMRLHACTGKQLVFDCTIAKVLDHDGIHTHWALMLRDITDRKELERELLEISDREQSRIGRDLHDALGQHLTALELYTTSLKAEVASQAPNLLKPLERIGGELREAIRQIRGVANGLSPASNHPEGLVNALRRLAVATQTMAGVSCEFCGDAHVASRNDSAATQLYRIAQEAITNALKHGRAKRIWISLNESSKSLELKIDDNGRGFSPASAKCGLGLRAMEYRADLIGATLRIDSKLKKGTQVRCTLLKSS